MRKAYCWQRKREREQERKRERETEKYGQVLATLIPLGHCPAYMKESSGKKIKTSWKV